jgi:hypothetical protein
MPSATPKPAPPPAAAPPAKAAPAPAPAQVATPDGWTVFHRLSILQIDGQEPTQAIEAVAEHDLGMSVTTGPLIVSVFPEDIHKAAALLSDLIRPQLVPLTALPTGPAPSAATPTPAPAPQADSPLEPIQLQQPADPATAPAAPEAITATVAAVEQLTAEWQTYILETFRLEFGLPANRKLATAIKSQAHVAFINGMLPAVQPVS